MEVRTILSNLLIAYIHLHGARWPHTVIAEKEGPNDGLVSVESSKWVSIDWIDRETKLIFKQKGYLPWNVIRREPSGLGWVDKYRQVQMGRNNGQGNQIQTCNLLPGDRRYVGT